MGKDESYLDAANMNNKVQFITADKKTGTVYVNEIDEAGNNLKTPFKFFDINKQDFEIVSDILFSYKTDFTKISYVGDISLNTTQANEKMYAFDNKIIFTYDKSNINTTYILTLDLNSKQSSLSKISHSDVQFNGLGDIKYNSFIFNKKLFQVSSSYTALKLSIKDLATGNTIKQYEFEENKDIAFKNGPIIQDGSAYDSEPRVLSKSNQLLRKIANSKVAVTANNNNDSTVSVTIGSYQEIKYEGVRFNSGGLPGMGYNGIPIASIGNSITLNVFAAPGLYNFMNNKTTKSAYFKTILHNADFSHITGDTKKSTFDRINDYEDSLENAKSNTMFAQNDGYVYGYYSSETKMYNLVKF